MQFKMTVSCFSRVVRTVLMSSGRCRTRKAEADGARWRFQRAASVGLEAAAFELLAGELDACAEEMAVFLSFVRELFLQLGDAFFVGLDALLERGVELFEAAFELVHLGLRFLLGGEEFGAVTEKGADEFLLHPREGSGADGVVCATGPGLGEPRSFLPCRLSAVVEHGEVILRGTADDGAAGARSVFAGTLDPEKAGESGKNARNEEKNRAPDEEARFGFRNVNSSQ